MQIIDLINNLIKYVLKRFGYSFLSEIQQLENALLRSGRELSRSPYAGANVRT